MRRLLCVLLLLFACASDPASEAGELRLHRDDDVYSPGSPVTATLVNRTSDVVFTSHCNFQPYLAIERRVGGEWVPDAQLNGPACLGIYPAGELRMEPRDSVVTIVTISAAGEYRLTAYGRRAWQDFGDLVAHSRAFTVRFPPD